MGFLDSIKGIFGGNKNKSTDAGAGMSSPGSAVPPAGGTDMGSTPTPPAPGVTPDTTPTPQAGGSTPTPPAPGAGNDPAKPAQ